MPRCPPQALALQSEVNFISHGHANWTAHVIGFAISGAATLLTWIISLVTITLHLRNFWQPYEQRQIVRILMLPMIYSLCSMLAYRYFLEYQQILLIQALSEGLALSSFLMLLLCYVKKVDGGLRHETIASKSRHRAPFPFCCVLYDPYKPAFLAVLTASVLQYGVVRFFGSIAGLIAQARDVLCSNSDSPKFANVWLEIIEFLSLSIGLYSLFLFYMLTKDILKGARNRAGAKFLSIKLLVAVLFYQEFLCRLLAAAGVIKASPYWSAAAISEGLLSMMTCLEMILFALLMMYAFSWADYRAIKPYPTARTPLWRSLMHCLNISDLALELWLASIFIYAYCRGRPGTRSKHLDSQLNAPAAFHDSNDFTSGSWELVEKPHTVSTEALNEADPEAAEPRSFRHTLGAHTPEINTMVEEIHDDHYIEPTGTRAASIAATIQRSRFYGQEDTFRFPSTSPSMPDERPAQSIERRKQSSSSA